MLTIDVISTSGTAQLPPRRAIASPPTLNFLARAWYSSTADATSPKDLCCHTTRLRKSRRDDNVPHLKLRNSPTCCRRQPVFQPVADATPPSQPRHTMNSDASIIWIMLKPSGRFPVLRSPPCALHCSAQLLRRNDANY
jgi:hypothetical protein